MKCRDNKLHDETYLKENMEKLFKYRAEHGFTPLTLEPPEGWPGQLEQAGDLVGDLISLGRNLENTGDVLPSLAPPAWTDSKQRQRQTLKKLAQGHKLRSEQEQQMDMTMM